MTTHIDIVRKLCEHNYATFIVGGAVRDMLNGNEPKDFDIVTAATPENIVCIFKDHNVKTVGKSFGVTLIDGFEVATFRHDRHTQLLDARKTIVEYANNIHEDLSRRDLTINALALCEITGELVDDFNGLNDLNRKIIRFVGDPVQRIKEDPVRIIRACRFLAKLGGNFDAPTFIALKEHSRYVKDHVAPERIRIEILKAMETKEPSMFFAALHIIGALKYILPSLEETVMHDHGKHHMENVWEHSMLVGDAISRKFPLVRLAGYLHDVGKPKAFIENEGNHFGGHSSIGIDIVRHELSKLRFSREEKSVVCGLVRSHMWLGSSEMTPKTVRKALYRLEELGVKKRDWMRLRIADRKGNVSKIPFTLADIKERASNIGILGEPLIDEPKISVHHISVSGGELIEYLGLKPGPIVSEIQNHLLKYLIENGWENDNPETLLHIAKEYINK